MTQLAEAFPWIATLVIISLCIFAIRLATKRSQGASGAGPVIRPEAGVPGLSETAWDLASIEHTLTNAPLETLQSLRQIAKENGIDLPPHSAHVPTDIERSLATIESELGIR